MTKKRNRRRRERGGEPLCGRKARKQGSLFSFVNLHKKYRQVNRFGQKVPRA